ncbi:phage capsid protein [Clostridia bacterium]|nr:phage capsid protein [Clostridia bacterium]
MANEISIYDPRTMDKIIKRIPAVHTFFLSTFFKRTKTFTTLSVDVDFKKGKRALAPFVHRRIGGKTVPNSGYQTKQYTPPYIAPDKVTTVDNLLQRMAGESLYNGMTPAERAVIKMAEDFEELNEMIVRREEWMAAQALLTGKIPVIGEGLDEIIDFNFTNTETLAAGKKWNAAGADPYADLKRWRRTVQQSGFVNCNIAVVADDVADALINSEKMKSVLDIKSYDLAVIKPRELQNGATYIGTIRELSLDIYSYNEWYLDDWTDPENKIDKPLVPSGTVLLASTNAEYSMYYGAVTILDGKGDKNETFVTVEGSRVPDTWTERKPARRFLQLNSNPLPVPHEVDSWFVASVL